MADRADLVLEHLRAIRADLGAVRETLTEHSYRFNQLESSMAGVRRDIANQSETQAHTNARIDKALDRIDRIERRLSLIDEAHPPA